MRAHPSAAELASDGEVATPAGGLPLPRPGRAGALRRQGHQPAGAGPLLFLDRRPAQGPAAAPRDGEHRAPCVPRAVRSGGARAAPHPAARAALQPAVEVVASLQLSQAHRRALPPARRVWRVARADGATYLGPFRSSAAAHQAREAIEDAVPLRRCGARIGRNTALEGGPPCVPAQLGVATCPCRAEVDEPTYADIADVARRGLRDEPAAAVRAARSTHAPARRGRAVRGGRGHPRSARHAHPGIATRAGDGRAARRGASRDRQRRRPARARGRSRRARRHRRWARCH